MAVTFNPFTGNLDFITVGDITGITAGTGLSGGGSSGNVTLDLANTAVTPASYTYTALTVDAQGRITSASNATVSASDRLLGRSSAGAGTVEEIACTAAGRALLDDADATAQRSTLSAAKSGAVGSSDLTMSTSRLLGRSTASTGAVEEITLGTNLSFSGTTLNAAGGGGGTPVYYNRRPVLHRGPLFTTPTATTLSVVAGAVLNGTIYAAATAVTMPGSFTNNTDYAIWQNPTTGALVADASFVTAPAGATGGSIVGGFHYIPSGRPTAFNNGSPTAAAEILEYSIWDLTWRPECPDPRGMTCVDGRFWCDLYLCGATSYAGTTFSAVPSSKIGLTIADNNSPPLIPGFYGGNGSTAYTLISGNNPGSWYNFTEVAHSFGKRLMFSWEFQAAAFGAPEANSRGTDPGTVIWERQSKWGVAQATGTVWTWAIERLGIFTSGTNTNTGGRGTELADAPRALLLGGNWLSFAAAGSRNASWDREPFRGNTIFGARFAAGHQVTG